MKKKSLSCQYSMLALWTGLLTITPAGFTEPVFNTFQEASVLFSKGVDLMSKKQETKAQEVFKQLTEVYPELSESHNNLAVLYAKQGDYIQAKIQLKLAIQTDPNNIIAHENLGDLYAKMAAEEYKKVLAFQKNDPNLSIKLKKINDLFGK